MVCVAGSDSAIWEACASQIEPSLLEGTLLRVVESQEQVATTHLVDGDLAKQDTLEQLIEQSKPSRRAGTERLDYLLATPWRYPPLRYGSRFGSELEPSLFYGALSINTALAETAYYRSVFLDDMTDPPPRIISQHTSFEARYRTGAGLKLHKPPFDAHASSLTDPADYRACQALGSALRDADIQAFEFASARDPEGGCNIALLQPAALSSKRHLRPVQWNCSLTSEGVSFRSRTHPSTLKSYSRAMFEIQGALPRPA